MQRVTRSNRAISKEKKKRSPGGPLADQLVNRYSRWRINHFPCSSTRTMATAHRRAAPRSRRCRATPLARRAAPGSPCPPTASKWARNVGPTRSQPTFTLVCKRRLLQNGSRRRRQGRDVTVLQRTLSPSLSSRRWLPRPSSRRPLLC